MKTNPRLLILLLVLGWVTACSSPNTTTPTAPTAATPDLATPSLVPTVQDAAHDVLQVFPLAKGITWIYTDTEFDPRPDKPNETIEAVYEITRQVAEVRSEGDVTLAEVRQTVKKVSADEGWSEELHNPPREYTFWYIVHENRVYSSSEIPTDLGAINYTALPLEFQFPMAQDAQWCPEPERGMEKIDPNFSGPTPFPCQYIGMRIIRKAGPEQTRVGSFDRCYQMEDVINGGGIGQTFCEGVGIVARRYIHAGTRFGFFWELTGIHK